MYSNDPSTARTLLPFQLNGLSAAVNKRQEPPFFESKEETARKLSTQYLSPFAVKC